VNLRKYWDENEAKKAAEAANKDIQLFTSQDFITEVSRVRDKCLSFLTFLNESIPRICERTEQLERDTNRDLQNEEDKDE